MTAREAKDLSKHEEIRKFLWLKRLIAQLITKGTIPITWKPNNTIGSVELQNLDCYQEELNKLSYEEICNRIKLYATAYDEDIRTFTIRLPAQSDAISMPHRFHHVWFNLGNISFQIWDEGSILGILYTLKWSPPQDDLYDIIDLDAGESK